MLPTDTPHPLNALQSDADIDDAVALRKELVRRAKAARAARIAIARQDVNTFIPFIMRNEANGAFIKQNQLQMTWHDLADKHPRLIIWSHVEAGKTQQLAVGRPIFELGRNNNLRTVIVSRTAGQSEKIARQIAQYIEHSKEVHEIFPDLKKGQQWAATKLTVQRDTPAKDPSITAIGVHGAILGARIDLLILDDILDYENTRTDHLRQDVINWFHSTLLGRLTPHARVIIIGNAYHPEDLLHLLARQPGWKAARFPVMDKKGHSTWPEQWPLERIVKKKEELGPLEFARQLMCVARSDAESRFKQDWIDKCLGLGRNRRLPHNLNQLPRGYQTFTGVDLGVKRSQGANLTVLFTIAVHPDGKREVLCVESGKWTADIIINKIQDHHRRYLSTAIVEDNAAQDFIIQFARMQTSVPIRPFTTTKRKRHPQYGVEGIAAELAAGRWIIPNDGEHIHAEIEAWIQEMLYYDPNSHTGDRLMASWFAREGARRGAIKAEFGNIDLLRR